MRTRDGYSITRESARHKFGGDPMAEYLHDLLGQGYVSDEETYHPSDGITEGTARFGRHLLAWDDFGFVYRQRYPTVDEAKRAFAEQASYYDGLDEEDEDDNGDFIATITGEEATVTDT